MNAASAQPADERLVLDWLGSFFNQIDEQLPAETKAALVKGCSAAHYRFLNMDETLLRFRGDLPGFMDFLSQAWGWKITQDGSGRVIRADENKPDCVCPLIQRGIVKRSSTLCSCSEGFAERMFAYVLEKPVAARVVASLLRGDPSCVYEVVVSA